MSNPCMCGRPIQDTANLCPRCGDVLRENLHKIADRWEAMAQCLTEAEAVERAEQGKAKNGMKSVGTSLNEQAVRARRACTDVVWFIVQVVREDMDNAGRPFTPPPTGRTRSQEDTPALARWLAAWHVSHITHKPVARETAEEIARDVAKAEDLAHKVVDIGPVKKVSTGLPCVGHATSEMGERVPCPGVMEAKLGRQMPDLVCSEARNGCDERIPPDVWSRQYWKRAHIVSESGAMALAERMTRQPSTQG